MAKKYLQLSESQLKKRQTNQCGQSYWIGFNTKSMPNVFEKITKSWVVSIARHFHPSFSFLWSKVVSTQAWIRLEWKVYVL